MQIDRAVEFIRVEYAELPGLKLTFWQVQRLLRLSEDECAAALKRLMEGQFLTRAADGSYVRRAGAGMTADGLGTSGVSIRV
jgi:hypothetical protein